MMDDSSLVLHPFPELHYARNHPPQGHQRFATLKIQGSKDHSAFSKPIHASPLTTSLAASLLQSMFDDSPRQSFVQSKRAVGRPESMKTELQHLAGGRRTRIIVIDLIRFRSLFAIPPSIFDWHRQQQRGGGFRNGIILPLMHLSDIEAHKSNRSNRRMSRFWDFEAHFTVPPG
ncbi:hypothetical protein C8J56DRAFT_512652 [Mycena floridula]|nr:hypothetical protein C8J56DRAFT_512652 [Mycena floridula]